LKLLPSDKGGREGKGKEGRERERIGKGGDRKGREGRGWEKRGRGLVRFPTVENMPVCLPIRNLKCS